MGELGFAFAAVAFALVPISISLWALLDAASRPEWAWALVGRRRVPWMAAIMAGTLMLVVGLTISLWYLLKVRPDVRAAERGDLRGLS